MKQALSTILLLLTIFSFALAQTNERYLVNSKTLNMRSGPGKEYKIIRTLSMGDGVISIEMSENGWWEVEYDGTQGYVFSSLLKIDPYSGWQKNSYQSGSTPDCENVTPKYNYELNNYLRINVGSGTDVVVKLIKTGYDEDECIRIVYVRSGDTYEINNIPEGRYYLKIAYGKDYRKKIVDNICYVKFMKDAQYEKGIKILDFNKIKQPNQIIGDKIYENWSVPSFELSLDVIVTNLTNPRFKSNNISEAEFNN